MNFYIYNKYMHLFIILIWKDKDIELIWFRTCNCFILGEITQKQLSACKMEELIIIEYTSIKPLPACILNSYSWFMMMNFCVKIDDQKTHLNKWQINDYLTS